MKRPAGRSIWLTLFMLSAAGFAVAGADSGEPPSTPRMRGFHIDMNISQFTGPYLKKELKRLADLGYDTIIWEVENNITWEACPECVSPDAFTKAEFKEILAYSRGLGLEPIPLLQTIGHCEYVLKHARYKPLAEVPDRIDQYCPQNPAVVPFLRKWIDEYLEVFGDIRYFHLGADEAYTLGECPRCRAYAAAHSLSALYIDHINSMSQPLIAKGIRPVIWADMLLHHPEALDRLSKQVVIYDWLYTRYLGSGGVWVWGQGTRGKDELDAATLARFGPYLYPVGDEPGRDPDPFYQSEYLAAHGFDVVICPSSSCWGDSVFAPRTFFHMRNTYDSFRRGLAGRLGGAVLTSWTVHLFPWELQMPSIELPKFVAAHPCGSLEDFQAAYVREHFGVEDTGFFSAAGRLANRGLFNYADDLGFFKEALPARREFVADRVEEMAKKGELGSELETCERRLSEYRDGLALFGAYAKVAKKGHEELKAWDLAARNLINRAEASRLLLRHRIDGPGPEIATEAGRILDGLQALRKETAAAVAAQVKPSRTAEMMQWMYDSMEAALEKAAGRAGGIGGR
jgi:hypothetical protein